MISFWFLLLFFVTVRSVRLTKMVCEYATRSHTWSEYVTRSRVCRLIFGFDDADSVAPQGQQKIQYIHVCLIVILIRRISLFHLRILAAPIGSNFISMHKCIIVLSVHTLHSLFLGRPC